MRFFIVAILAIIVVFIGFASARSMPLTKEGKTVSFAARCKTVCSRSKIAFCPKACSQFLKRNNVTEEKKRFTNKRTKAVVAKKALKLNKNSKKNAQVLSEIITCPSGCQRICAFVGQCRCKC